MNMQKSIGILFIALFIVSLMPISAFAHDSNFEDGYNHERTIRIRDQVHYERTLNYERLDNYNNLRRRRFLDSSPYYYDRIYYNRGSGYRDYRYDRNYNRNRGYDRGRSYDRNRRLAIIRYNYHEIFDRDYEFNQHDNVRGRSHRPIYDYRY